MMWILTLLESLIASWMVLDFEFEYNCYLKNFDVYVTFQDISVHIYQWVLSWNRKWYIDSHPRRNQWLQQSQDPHHCLEGNTEELNGTLYNLMKLLPEPVVALIHPPVLTDISVVIFDVQKSCSEMKNHGNWNLKSSRARSMQRLWNKLCNSSVTRKSFKLAT